MQKPRNHVREYILYRLGLFGVSCEDAAGKLGMSPSTLTRRLKSPGTFNVHELIILGRLGQFDPRNILTVIADSRKWVATGE